MNAIWRGPVQDDWILPWASRSIVQQFPFGSGHRNKTTRSIADLQSPAPITRRPNIPRAPNLVREPRRIGTALRRQLWLNPAAAGASFWQAAVELPEPANSINVPRFQRVGVWPRPLQIPIAPSLGRAVHRPGRARARSERVVPDNDRRAPETRLRCRGLWQPPDCAPRRRPLPQTVASSTLLRMAMPGRELERTWS